MRDLTTLSEEASACHRDLRGAMKEAESLSSGLDQSRALACAVCCCVSVLSVFLICAKRSLNER